MFCCIALKRGTQVNTEVEYLLSLLKDEFEREPQVRIRSILPSGTRRALDLEQNYDPESSSIHLKQGVQVRVKDREFYFPAAWVRASRFQEIHALIAEVRRFLESWDLSRS